MPTVSLHTLGCKLNFAETLALGRQFRERGFDIVEFGAPADVCVINTCSVTARANRECRQTIRKALRMPSPPYMIVTGCYAQLEPEEVASIESVDLVLGAGEKHRLFDHVTSFEKNPQPHILVSEITTVDNFGPAYSSGVGDRTRAYLKVQDGCDYNCSFCTIPLARGASRSQPVEQCLEQARSLVGNGFKEITLTGVNVGDYGMKSGTSLFRLLRAMEDIEGLDRIRISSIEPNLLTEEILAHAAVSKKLCPHFHIPLQSGSDDILRKMRRRYTSSDYETLIRRIKRTIPACGLGVDVIAGFPGETDRHFEQTVNFLDNLPVSYLHVFTYSERPQTPAAVLPNAIEPKVRFTRSEILRCLGRKKKHAFHSSMVGETIPVLFENDVDAGMRFGFTGNYARVGVPAESSMQNTIVPVRVHDIQEDFCIGKLEMQQVAA